MTHQNKPVEDKSDRQFGDELHGHFVLEADRLKEREVRLAEEVKAARKYLDESADQFKLLWIDWIDDSKKAVKDMRELRMALDSERHLVKSALGDLKAAIEDNKATIEEIRRIVDSLVALETMAKNGFLARLTDLCSRIIK